MMNNMIRQCILGLMVVLLEIYYISSIHAQPLDGNRGGSGSTQEQLESLVTAADSFSMEKGRSEASFFVGSKTHMYTSRLIARS